jgi:hypothetical protein
MEKKLKKALILKEKRLQKAFISKVKLCSDLKIVKNA